MTIPLLESRPRAGRLALIVALTMSAAGGALPFLHRSLPAARRSHAVILTPPRDSSGDTVPVLGPLVFAQTGSKAATYVEQFSDQSPPTGQTYRMKVENIASPGNQLIDSAKISLGSTVIFAPSAFASRPALLSAPVTLSSSGTLTVTVGHGTGAYLRITILPVVQPEFTIYGPVQLTIPTGQTSLTFSDSFAVPAAAGAATTLAGQNGDSAGGHRLPTTTHASLTLNGTTPLSVTSIPSGAAGGEAAVTLLRGGAMNHFTVSITQATAGATVSFRFAATDTAHPVLSITNPPANGFATKDSITVSGTVTDYLPSQVTVNGIQATMQPGGAWSAAKVPLLNEGPDTLHVIATDVAGNQTRATRVVTRVTQAPVVTVSAPTNGSYTNHSPVTVNGTATGSAFAQPLTVTVNGTPVTPGGGGTFSTTAALSEGSNFVTVVATDAAGNATTVANKVTLATHVPTVTITSPTNGSSTTNSSTPVTGTATGEVGLTNVTVDGSAVTLGSGGAFSTTVNLAVGSNTVTVVATDSAGNTTTATSSITRTQSGGGGGQVVASLPIDTSVHAPTLSSTVNTSLFNSSSFLYSGSNPLQTGVSAGTIQLATAAVIRGRVLDETGTPLPGVTVSVVGHPEYGQMITTNPAGQYDLAVNGGTSLALSFVAPGRLPIQRRIAVPWQDYAIVADAMMIPVDPTVTTVDFTQPEPVARGSVVHDTNGTRQATLLFAQGTTATMVMPDGTTQPLPTPSVRATEYTVGPNGRARMPADLPPTSSYTYAVSLTADQARAAGASSVTFSQPVSVYVENFLQVPLGISVPSAAYDPTHGIWAENPDGTVIQIVGASGGVAHIAVNSADTAADSTTLAQYGFSTPELTQLAALYPVGQSLWRLRVSHFTDYDFNFAGNGDDPSGGGAGGPPQDCPCQDSVPGSTVGAESQSLGESIPLPGTAFNLHYASNQTPGYVASRTLEVPIFGDSLPIGVQAVDIRLTVGGQAVEQIFSPGQNLTIQYAWNGLDGFGRVVHGAMPITYYTAFQFANHNYTGQFYSPAVSASTFAGGGQRLAFGDERIGASVGKVSRTVVVRNWDSRGDGLGGWTLDIHHTYDPVGREIHRGDGSTIAFKQLPSAVSLVAGGSQFGFSGDGGPADSAQLSQVNAVAVGSDGSVYILDQASQGARIRKVSPNGIITTIAGPSRIGSVTNCIRSPMPAASAPLNGPTGIAVSSDNILYIADGGANCVWKVDLTSGMLSTAAGTGTRGFAGDGGPATAAQLRSPTDVAVGRTGDLYIADAGNSRVRRISPSGNITTIAGDGLAFPIGAGTFAVQQSLAVQHVAVAPDGTVYLNGSGVWRVPPDGTIQQISTVNFTGGMAVDAGGLLYIANNGGGVEGGSLIYTLDQSGLVNVYAGCTTVSACGSVFAGGGYALQSFLALLQAVAVGPNGAVYTAEEQVVRAVGPTLPGVRATDFLLGSKDGREIYQFDFTGRHLATFDGWTGLPTYRFSYDSTGLLTTIVDRDSQVTTIHRTNGVPTTIVGPNGQTNALSVDSNGYLSSVTDPVGGVIRLKHQANGLLTSFTDASNNQHQFQYDSLGRLMRDQDPTGVAATFGRADTGSAATVSVRDPAGLTTSLRWAQLPSGDQQQVTTYPDGTTATVSETGNDSTVSNFSDGMAASIVQAPDPVLGGDASYIQSATLTTPGGLSARVTQSRHALPGASGIGVASAIDSVKLNGATLTVAFDAASQRFVITSPAGRSVVDSLDALGHVVRESSFGRSPVTATYDPSGRQITAQVGGRLWQYSYNTAGLVSTIIDPAHGHTAFTYDPAGRLLARTNPDGNTTSFGYDSSGNVTSVTPPGKSAHLFHYSPNGLVDAYTPPAIDAGPSSTVYGYDADQHLSSVTRPDGVTITLGYDAGGRLQSTSFGGTTVFSSYDGTTGNVSQVSRSDGDTLRFTYDGSLLTSASWSGPVAGTVSATYDGSFRLAQQTVDDSLGVTYSYDADAHVIAAGSETIQRDSLSALPIGTSLGDVSSSDAIDGFGSITNRTATFQGAPLMQLSYGRDSSGHVTSLTENMITDTTIWQYQYDTAGRLTAVTRNGVAFHSFQYDQNDNRTTFNSTNGSASLNYDAQDRLINDGANSYTYSRDGTLQSRTGPSGTITYTYDALGNVTAVAMPNGTTITYIVDGLNRRVGKRVNGQLVKGWLYQGSLQPVAELDSLGNVVSRFVYGSSAAVPDYMTRGGNTYRLVSDVHGSVRLVVDVTAGTIVQRIDYDEFGAVLANSNPGFQPFAFAGGFYDDDTQLERIGLRDYDASVGRWTAKDPIVFGGGQTNLYVYLGDNPTGYTDPLGLGGFGDWVTSPGVVNAVAGFGDALSFEATDAVRYMMGANDVVNRCGHGYRDGHAAGTALAMGVGFGRIAYAGAARLLPIIYDADEALAASSGRNLLKQIFRGDILGLSKYRMYDPEKLLETRYGGDMAAMLAGSGRTNVALNSLGVASFFQALRNAYLLHCVCKQ